MKNSRPCFLFRTDILQKTVARCFWEVFAVLFIISYPASRGSSLARLFLAREDPLLDRKVANYKQQYNIELNSYYIFSQPKDEARIGHVLGVYLPRPVVRSLHSLERNDWKTGWVQSRRSFFAKVVAARMYPIGSTMWFVNGLLFSLLLFWEMFRAFSWWQGLKTAGHAH